LSLSGTQKGVLKGVIAGALIALIVIGTGATFNPFDYEPDITVTKRLSIAVSSGMFVSLFLAISIGRLAKHRFFDPESINGGGLTPGSPDAMLLQSLLQNTLEQVVLAFSVYLAWALIMPSSWLSVIPLAAITFGVGRILFYVGYRNGAPSRALGFALTFYPSVGMLVCLIATVVWRQFGG
jgi:hypothetical protein